MKKIYCVYCGKENKAENKKCSSCKKELNPKENIWRDYIYNHIRDDLKDKVEDKTSSLIINFITSHIYGLVISILVIATAVNGVVKVVNNNSIEVESVLDNPVKIEELALDNEIVKSIYERQDLNDDRFFDVGFYEDKQVSYDSISEIDRIMMAYMYDFPRSDSLIFNTCEETRKYPDIYDLCLQDSSWVIGDYANDYYKIDLDKLNNNYKTLFGSDKSFKVQDFTLYYSRICKYYEDLGEYLCHTLPAGWNSGFYEYTNLEKVYKVNDIIEIYDYYTMFVYVDEWYGTYKDNQMKNKISDEPDENLIKQGQLYRHVYKLDNNGNYYWVSSEPVDKIN